MSAIRWIMGAILSVSVFVSQVAAAQFSVTNGAILISGNIVQGDADRLAASIAKYGNLRIDLVSNGGSLSEALRMGEVIRDIGLATNIPQGVVCASACVTVFAGGVIRTAHEDSRIGIHMASGVFNEQFINEMDTVINEYGIEATPILVSMFEEGAAAAMLAQVYYFLEAGVSLELLKVTLFIPHYDEYWLDYGDAVLFNLVNYP